MSLTNTINTTNTTNTINPTQTTPINPTQTTPINPAQANTTLDIGSDSGPDAESENIFQMITQLVREQIIKGSKTKIDYMKEYGNWCWDAFILIPFIVCDLYWANKSTSCQSINTSMKITLYDWLMTNGIISAIYLFVFFIFVCMKNTTKLQMVIMKTIILLFSCVWAIVGAVLWWNHVKPTELCDSQVNTYVQTRMILTMISIGFVLSMGVFGLVTLGFLIIRGDRSII
jgi:hypothetical protein